MSAGLLLAGSLTVSASFVDGPPSGTHPKPTSAPGPMPRPAARPQSIPAAPPTAAAAQSATLGARYAGGQDAVDVAPAQAPQWSCRGIAWVPSGLPGRYVLKITNAVDESASVTITVS